MNHEPSDARTTVLAANIRRRALGSLLGIAFLSRCGLSTTAKPGKAKKRGHSKRRGQGHENDRGQGHVFDEQCLALSCEQLPVPRTTQPEFCCEGEFCSCDGECCEEDCFQVGDRASPDRVFCCVGEGLVICGEGEQAQCCEGSCDRCQDLGQTGIAGSYRRPR